MKTNEQNSLDSLCAQIREYVLTGNLENGVAAVCDAMSRFPNAPQPHNLMGILQEKLGNHVIAIRHFRAAWALDPTYTPAEENLETYTTFFGRGKCAYDESDCRKNSNSGSYPVIYDTKGVGHVIRRDQ